MAAAYAAVMSLMNTIDRVLHEDRFLIFDWNEELRSIKENSITLQTFLEESFHSTDEEVKHMEVRIRDAAHEAQDFIDGYILIFILESEGLEDKLELQKVNEEIASISNELKKNKPGSRRDLPLSNNFLTASSSSTYVPPRDRNARSTMIGFEKDLVEIKSLLVGNQSGLQIIPIVGMGGSGKTTLAKNVYDDSLIVHHFHVRCWATVSQVYDIRDIILSLLGNNEKLQQKSTEDLEVDLHKRLKERKYLIILDDVWDKEFCDHVRRLFPDDDNGSRIMLTTRQLYVAEYVDSLTSCHPMSFLDEDASWNLLKNKVFGKEDCTPELETIGRVIARDCKGLPLAIVVIAGFLAKVEKTSENWRALAENLKSVLAQSEEECIEVLYLSYRYLPPHLKPCFLYMGAFPEDDVVSVTRLVHLWMAEGFLKPVHSKSLVDVAHEYVEDLIDRNLLLAHERDINGKAKSCKIHDILRQLCLREANKENFIYVFDNQVLQGAANEQHRVAICKRYGMHDSLPVATHSLICNTHLPADSKVMLSLKIRDLGDEVTSISHLLQFVNLRYITCQIDVDIPFSLSRFWNLQTLILKDPYRRLPSSFSDIWEMSDLKYIDISRLSALSAPTLAGDSAPLENLEIMYGTYNITWTKEVIRKLPNLKKLEITYSTEEDPWDDNHVYNLRLLQKLEELNCRFQYPYCLHFPMIQWLPESLKELMINGGHHPWSAMTNIGSLPNLQVLRLEHNAFSGKEWEPNEGEFLQLKVLELLSSDVIHWRAESSHFPLLIHLVLAGCYRLMEIPSGIGEIPTLEKIEVIECSEGCEESAKRILDEQREDYGNDILQLIVRRSEW